jgi:hypothetical protein
MCSGRLHCNILPLVMLSVCSLPMCLPCHCVYRCCVLCAGLVALAGMQSLQELVLHNCLRISGEGLRVSRRCYTPWP